MIEHQYFVYGVSIVSDMPFDFPAPVREATRGPSVRFARGEDEHFREATPDRDRGRWFVCRELADGSVYFRWSGLYEFLVDSCGSCVRYRPIDNTDARVLQNFLFGQALSFALVRQQLEPVHAAVVDIGGVAIALLGDCTYGKSTLAGAFLSRGCRLISDDVLVVNREGTDVLVQAGTGRIKLMPDSARAWLRGAEGTPVIPGSAKHAFQLEGRMVQRDPVPLRAFVVVPSPDERRACARIELQPIGRARLFHELVKNTYVRYLEGSWRLRQNFASNTQLAEAVDACALRYPPGIGRLPLVAATVVEHLRARSQGDAA